MATARHPLDQGTEPRQIKVALPPDEWRVLDGLMQAMEEIDQGGTPHRYGYLLSAGFLQFRSLTRKSGSALSAWRTFLEDGVKRAESDEAASGAVWQHPYRAWARFWRIAWEMWWRYQMVNVSTGLLVYYLPGPPAIHVGLAIVWAVFNVLGLGLAVSRAFNVYTKRYGSLPVLFGKPYG